MAAKRISVSGLNPSDKRRKSNFIDRNELIVMHLQEEIGEALEHEVTVSEYLIRGKDHLGKSTINQYSIERELGEGSFGKVYHVHENETHEDFAMKVYSKQTLLSKKDTMVIDKNTGRLVAKNYLDEIYKEIEIMKHLNHTNVVRLSEVIDHEDKLILIIDYCAKGEILGWDEETSQFSPYHKSSEPFDES